LTLIVIIFTGASLATFPLLPLQFEVLFGSDTAYVSRLLLAPGFSLIVGTILSNWIFSYFGGANREILGISALLMAAGVGALAAVTKNTPSLAVGLSFVGGFGAGGIVQPAITMLTVVTADERIGTIAGWALCARLVAGSVGFAIYRSVLTNKLADILPANIGNAAVAAGLPLNQVNQFLDSYLGTNTTELAQYSSTILLAAQDATTESYVVGFRLIHLISIAFGGSAVIASLFLGDIRNHMVDRVAVDIE